MKFGTSSLGTKIFIIAVFFAIVAFGLSSKAQDENDPNRPSCTTAACKRIKSYLKAHYCGQSPAGNGPDDGCEIEWPKRPRSGVVVLADYRCTWSDIKKEDICKQIGQPSASVHTILFNELRRLGLPSDAKGQTQFYVLNSVASGFLVASASYSHDLGIEEELCEVIVVIDKNSHVSVLRELRFQKVNADVPRVTEWTPMDLADADGDGMVEIILDADAYEDHWIEVVSMYYGYPKTIFSGLGYYL